MQGQAIRKSLTAGLASLGVPMPIAAKIADVVAKYGPKLIAAVVLTGLLLGTAIIVSLFGGSLDDQQPDAYRSRQSRNNRPKCSMFTGRQGTNTACRGQFLQVSARSRHNMAA